MQVGAMNNPARSLDAEVRRIADNGFDFIDVTLEPPQAWPITGKALRRILSSAEIPAVGHTAYYLPLATPFPDIRRRALVVFERVFDVFSEAGVRLVNVHPGTAPRLIPWRDVQKWNAEAIALLTRKASALGLRLMVENLPAVYTDAADFDEIFAAAPDAAFHLDVGHANIGPRHGEPNRCGTLLKAFGRRLAHVHVHDNLGAQDLHLPVGSGTTDWQFVVSTLKAAGWDGTVTAEVFSPYPELVQQSRTLWLELWNGSRGIGGSGKPPDGTSNLTPK